MEEVARMYGYENFEAAPITTSFDGAINQLDKDLERKIKEYLSFRCGMQELSLIHISAPCASGTARASRWRSRRASSAASRATA